MTRRRFCAILAFLPALVWVPLWKLLAPRLLPLKGRLLAVQGPRDEHHPFWEPRFYLADADTAEILSRGEPVIWTGPHSPKSGAECWIARREASL